MNWNLLFNYGFPAVLCIYLLFSFGKKIDKLDHTISNDLIHTIEKQGEIIKKDSENTEKVEKAIEKLTDSIDRFGERIK